MTGMSDFSPASSAVARQAAERALEAYKRATAHRYSSTFWGLLRYGLGLGAAFLSVVAGTDAFGSGTAKYAGVIGGLAAAAVTFLTPGETAEKHRAAAARWEDLDRKATTVVEAHVPIATPEELLRQLDRLVNEADKIGEESPNIVPWMYAIASSRAGRKRPRYRATTAGRGERDQGPGSRSRKGGGGSTDAPSE